MLLILIESIYPTVLRYIVYSSPIHFLKSYHKIIPVAKCVAHYTDTQNSDSGKLFVAGVYTETVKYISSDMVYPVAMILLLREVKISCSRLERCSSRERGVSSSRGV